MILQVVQIHRGQYMGGSTREAQKGSGKMPFTRYFPHSALLHVQRKCDPQKTAFLQGSLYDTHPNNTLLKGNPFKSPYILASRFIPTAFNDPLPWFPNSFQGQRGVLRKMSTLL